MGAGSASRLECLLVMQQLFIIVKVLLNQVHRVQ